MKKIGKFLILLLILSVIGAIFYLVDVSFKSPEEVREYVQSFGAYGPLVVIALITLEVILAPVPGAIISIGSGAAFGFVLGTVYTYIGNLIGSSIAFMLSRHFGRPLVKHLIKEKHRETYDNFLKDKGVYGLWIAYMFPVFPVDIISFLTGLSNLRFKQFLKIISIGFIPNMLLLNYFGDSLLSYGFGISTIIIASFLALIFIFSFLYMVRYKPNN